MNCENKLISKHNKKQTEKFFCLPFLFNYALCIINYELINTFRPWRDLLRALRVQAL